MTGISLRQYSIHLQKKGEPLHFSSSCSGLQYGLFDGIEGPMTDNLTLMDRSRVSESV